MSEKTNKKEAPRGLITPEQAKTLDQAYNCRHKLISSSILERPDNRSTWFSIEELEKFLAYAKSEATELGYTLDGIRLYEGAYPEEKGQLGYTTMFLIPTGSTPDNIKTKSLKVMSPGSGDIPGGSGLNMGQGGTPPQANYPQ
ncbi:hypothetical protein [Formosa sp. PL04]|uniref:hypothetical protein n=1 Tax=Formosa sp. PL04 TaxID=3081755 RepID=UPI0029818E75|nr:hypothetical protein [Formosa sp. PL04]MDW5289869.1 hypothetical protein [Formosa sp. PL04]